MKMRVSLARALVTDPDILLMDEPFAALDEITRFKLNDDLLSIWRTLRKTIVFVTHSVFESVYLSQRVLVMTSRPGRIGEEFRIDSQDARDADFRTSADYAAHCRKVSAALAKGECNGRRAMTPDRSSARLLQICLPVLTLALGVAIWEAVVRINEIPDYVLPAPSVVFATLVQDWSLLFGSLLTTLLTTVQGFIAAAVGGIVLAMVFSRSKWLEYALFPYAVILQVTPVIAIAPLLLIYLPQHLAVVACAWIVAFFPVLSNTTLGLKSVDRNLAGLFALYGASRTQTMRYLKLPSALPHIMGAYGSRAACR